MKFNPTLLTLTQLKINTMDRNSTLRIGQGIQGRNYSIIKKNQGFGESNGDRMKQFFLHTILDDDDRIDTSALHQSMEISS